MWKRFEFDFVSVFGAAPGRLIIYLWPVLEYDYMYNSWVLTLWFWNKGIRIKYIKKNYWWG